jgi:hypothetical protein
MINLKRCIVYLSAIFAVLVGYEAQVHAQSLSFAPAFVDATVKRGSTYTKTFTVTNGTDTRLRLRCSVGDFWYGENNERIDGLPGTLPRSASPWVQFTPAELIVEPNSSNTVNAVISVPLTASGGYYTVPTFEAEAAGTISNAANQSNAAAAASVVIRFRGMLLLATEDATEYNVEIMSSRLTPPTASSGLEIALDIRNRSTGHARVRGVIAFLNESGKLAGRGKIEEKRYLPGQRDILRSGWAGELPPGHYVAMITLTYDRAGMDPATLVYELHLDVH